MNRFEQACNLLADADRLPFVLNLNRIRNSCNNENILFFYDLRGTPVGFISWSFVAAYNLRMLIIRKIDSLFNSELNQGYFLLVDYVVVLKKNILFRALRCFFRERRLIAMTHKKRFILLRGGKALKIKKSSNLD